MRYKIIGTPKKNFNSWLRPLFWPRTKNQTPNPSRETVPLSTEAHTLMELNLRSLQDQCVKYVPTLETYYCREKGVFFAH